MRAESASKQRQRHLRQRKLRRRPLTRIRRACARQGIAGLGVLFIVVWATPAASHDARPIQVQLTETGTGLYSLSWRAPSGVSPRLHLPAGCVAEAQPGMRPGAGANAGHQRFWCPGGLAGRTFRVGFVDGNPSLPLLINTEFINGQRHTQMLGPDEREWIAPQRESATKVATEYARLGVEHIATGYDHLLFIACLLFIAQRPRTLLVTITGFTVAHSLTLAASVLDWIRLPTPPIEATISLSILCLAAEIIRGDKNSLTYRHPAAISTTFGLLHGFGFATVLRDIGLPQTELPTALLFFNLGVELGQLLFVGLLLAAALLFRLSYRRFKLRPSWLLDMAPDSSASGYAVATGYAAGALAAFWTIERVAGF